MEYLHIHFHEFRFVSADTGGFTWEATFEGSHPTNKGDMLKEYILETWDKIRLTEVLS